MRRSDLYEEELSKKLKNKRFAQSFILGLVEASDDDESGMSVENALRHTIARMGVKEFSESALVPTSNIQEFLKGKRKLKPETLDAYLRPFGLKTRISLEKAS